MYSKQTDIDEAEVLERSHGYWSGRAPEYSQLHEDELASERGQKFSAFLKSLPCVFEGARVLDLGCGSGIISVILAGAGCEVTGADYSEAMLEQAQANCSKHGVQAQFKRMPAQALDFDDEVFDLVITRNVTWVLQDVDKVYAEVLRVLKPGGSFVNIDAHYGKAMVEARRRGETPVHPTQTAEQLEVRDSITRDLDITYVDRPMWDVRTLWDLGASYVGCHRDFEGLMMAQGEDGANARRSGISDRNAFNTYSARTHSPLFIIEAMK